MGGIKFVKPDGHLYFHKPVLIVFVFTRGHRKAKTYVELCIKTIETAKDSQNIVDSLWQKQIFMVLKKKYIVQLMLGVCNRHSVAVYCSIRPSFTHNLMINVTIPYIKNFDLRLVNSRTIKICTF